jgi:hypothetical protein
MDSGASDTGYGHSRRLDGAYQPFYLAKDRGRRWCENVYRRCGQMKYFDSRVRIKAIFALAQKTSYRERPSGKEAQQTSEAVKCSCLHA